MRRIAHLSDLHFGRVDSAAVDALARTLHGLAPDLIAVSGDLTQRARHREFRAARAFLDSLPFPRLVVPGNHDIPLYALHLRLLAPYRRYCEYFGGEQGLEPWYADDEIAVAGLSSVRHHRVSHGWLGRRQLAALRARFEAEGGGKVRILVAHHPWAGGGEEDGGGRSGRPALPPLVDLALTGHLHVVSQVAKGGTLRIQAGSAVSTRLRGEANSFNLVEVERGRIRLRVHAWDRRARSYVESGPGQCSPREGIICSRPDGDSAAGSNGRGRTGSPGSPR